MIGLCFEYLSVRSIWMYVIIMSRLTVCYNNKTKYVIVTFYSETRIQSEPTFYTVAVT